MFSSPVTFRECEVLAPLFESIRHPAGFSQQNLDPRKIDENVMKMKIRGWKFSRWPHSWRGAACIQLEGSLWGVVRVFFLSYRLPSQVALEDALCHLITINSNCLKNILSEPYNISNENFLSRCARKLLNGMLVSSGGEWLVIHVRWCWVAKWFREILSYSFKNQVCESSWWGPQFDSRWQQNLLL